MLVFPTHAFPARRQKWRVIGVETEGGRSLSGQRQIIVSDGGGYWRADLSEIVLRSADQLRAWRGWAAVLERGAAPFVFELCDPRQRPALVVNGVEVKGHTARWQQPDADGGPAVDTPFSDDTAFESLPVIASTAADAPARATEIMIDVPDVTLRGGEYFSIDHEGRNGHRLYVVALVRSVSGARYAVSIRPPLRAATAAGRALDFNRPRLVCRLAEPDAMDLDIENAQRATVALALVEDVWV